MSRLLRWSGLPLAAALMIPVCLAADRAVDGGAARDAAWREVAWPLPRDQFPAGRAFACPESACGSPLRVTVRPKVGFCNCLTGVSDDDELERVGDVDLLGRAASPRDVGREIAVGGRAGRARVYVVGARDTALSIAFNETCDVVVATATGAESPEAQRAVLEFLGAPRVSTWVQKALGL